MLCKHEVVGSIPSGSTSLRWLRQLRLGEPVRGEGRHVEAPKGRRRTGADADQNHRPRNITSHVVHPHQDAACGISDIVKRRSIRVGSCEQSRGPSQSPGHFRRSLIARCAGCKMTLSAKLDRLAVGSILRSKLVFLISVRPIHSHSSRVRVRDLDPQQMFGMHSAECVDIDNESNQVP